MTNTSMAARFDAVAALLEQQRANPFRVQAYRAGAATLRRLEEPVTRRFEREGIPGLERLPAIGTNLARAIRDMIVTGRMPILDRLRGEVDPIVVLQSIPGIGPRTADRLHHDLGIDTLEDLERAAHNGGLQRVPGLGAKRIAGIQDVLAARLGRTRYPIPATVDHEPPVAELLSVDREYRDAARRNSLPMIAPRRFNPTRRPWLPILHTQRADRAYTALYSNTARAHRLARTHDWVVLVYDGSAPRGRATVITARRGPLAGRRVVRGRELECDRFYREAAGSSRSSRSIRSLSSSS